MYKLSSNALPATASQSPSHRLKQGYELILHMTTDEVNTHGYPLRCQAFIVLSGCISSLKLQGLNDCKDSKLHMLHEAKAKNLSSVRVFLFFWSGLADFLLPMCVYVSVFRASAYTQVHWCQKSA